jgi:hypothetical protein
MLIAGERPVVDLDQAGYGHAPLLQCDERLVPQGDLA